MDGCNVLPETQFVGNRLRVDTTRVLSVGGNLPPCGAAGERSESNIKPPLGAPLLIFPRGYLLKSFPRVDTSARHRGFEIRVFPLLGELPKAIEPHLPVCQLCHWQARSQHVVFAYDQVVRPHRSYRPSGGLPRGKPRTRRMWICLQLSGARGVDNGGVSGDGRGSTSYIISAGVSLVGIAVIVVVLHYFSTDSTCHSGFLF